MIKLIEETTHEVYIAVSSSDIIRMYYTEIPDIIKKAIKRNITIKLMSDSELLTKQEYIKRLGFNSFKIVTLPSSGRLLCNKSQVLMSNNTSPFSNKNLDKESTMITNSKDIVNNMNSFCGFLWESSKEILVNNKNNKKPRKSQKQSIVLLVDDDQDAVDLFSDYLEIKGISSVEKCTKAKNALMMFKQIRLDVVFLDIMMPEFDGFHVLGQIRKIDPNARVIIVTADLSLETKKKLDAIHPTDIIYKPYDIKQILKHLKI